MADILTGVYPQPRTVRDVAGRLRLMGYSLYSPSEVKAIPDGEKVLADFDLTVTDPDAVALVDLGWLVIPKRIAREVDSAIARAKGQPFRARLALLSDATTAPGRRSLSFLFAAPSRSRPAVGRHCRG